MTDDEREPAGHSQEAALAVLKACAEDPEIRADYRTIAEAFTEDDYQQIVALAWRHQFSEDRYAFRREMRELQQYVCGKVRLPGNEVS